MPDHNNTENPKESQGRPRRSALGQNLLEKIHDDWGEDPVRAVGFAGLVLALEFGLSLVQLSRALAWLLVFLCVRWALPDLEWGWLQAILGLISG